MLDSLPISRQAVSKHLAVFTRVGLVEGEQSGREMRYRLNVERLDQADTSHSASSPRSGTGGSGASSTSPRLQPLDSRERGMPVTSAAAGSGRLEASARSDRGPSLPLVTVSLKTKAVELTGALWNLYNQGRLPKLAALHRRLLAQTP